MKVSWFSAGVSSAVATKLSNPDLIIYQHIDDQHSDTLRFVADCEKWFGKKIIIQQPPMKNVENACLAASAISMWGFSPCTKFLKKRVRKEWEILNPGRHTYVWGMDADEAHRMDRIVQGMPEYDHEFPLKELSKQDCHGILKSAGIARPKMYDLGYPNNNCVGCVRAKMGYWNKIREDFPQVFSSRAKLERTIGHSIIKDCYLDELEPGRGRDMPIILEDCGAACQVKSSDINDTLW